MQCKNCENTLRTDFTYCPSCGAKVIRNRITMRNLWHDIVERFFNLDNSFIRTVKDLFIKPQVVIGGYIDGQRKKYFNPISYFTVALTLSSILIFVLQQLYGNEGIDFTGGAKNINPEFAEKWSNILFDYNSLFFVLYIPVLALPSYLFLNKVKYNLAEHVVIFLYVLAHYSICSFPVSLLVAIFDVGFYLDLGRIMLVVLALYSLFVLYKINGYKISTFIPKSLLFGMIASILFFMIILFFLLMLIVTGVFSLQDFAPPKN